MSHNEKWLLHPGMCWISLFCSLLAIFWGVLECHCWSSFSTVSGYVWSATSCSIFFCFVLFSRTAISGRYWLVASLKKMGHRKSDICVLWNVLGCQCRFLNCWIWNLQSFVNNECYIPGRPNLPFILRSLVSNKVWLVMSADGLCGICCWLKLRSLWARNCCLLYKWELFCIVRLAAPCDTLLPQF